MTKYTVLIRIEARASIFYKRFLTRCLNESGIYLNPGINFLHCSPVQGRMAGASTSIYKFDSVFRGQHIYKSVWTSLTNWCSKTRKCIPVREDNERDKYTIDN